MLVKPSFYDKFFCVASKCQDNCCIGWEIDIDKETDCFYRGVDGSFREQLDQGISRKEEPHFLLKGERCFFLNGENLCDIFLNLGEEHLCEICREHPRFYEWYEEIPGLPNRKEAGLGLCCEEAVRLLFSDQKPLTFIIEWEDEEEKIQWEREVREPKQEEAAYLLALFSARDRAFSLLQDRRMNLASRIRLFLMMAEDIQDCLDVSSDMRETAEQIRKAADWYGDKNQVKLFLNEEEEKQNEKREAYFHELLLLMGELEPIHDSWTDSVAVLDKNLKESLSPHFDSEYGNRKDYEYEHLLVYFVYRYFGKSAFDGDVLSKAKLAVLTTVLVRLMDLDSLFRSGGFLGEQRMEYVRVLSKEIEYSEENLKFLEKAFWEEEILSTESLSDAADTLWKRNIR